MTARSTGQQRLSAHISSSLKSPKCFLLLRSLWHDQFNVLMKLSLVASSLRFFDYSGTHSKQEKFAFYQRNLAIRLD